jgi:hypothetical protein
LSIIENPKPSRGSYGKWLGDKKQPSVRDDLRRLIDDKLIIGRSYGEFLASLKMAGCEVNLGKHTSIRLPGGKKNIRFDSLGDDYTEDAIKERLMGKRDVIPRQAPDNSAERKTAEYIETIKRQNAPNLMIDIQAKIQDGASEGYQHWMRIFNLKQAANTLIFLKENGIDSYEDLVKKSSSASSDFSTRTKRIREIESRQKDISELQKQIGTYGKTRDIYAKYKASGWDRGFYDIHATDIILHKAAKKYFDRLGIKKLPSISQLKQEYATLADEKRKLYNGYHELKDRHVELLKAKDNCERILGINRDASERAAEHEKQRRDHGAR